MLKVVKIGGNIVDHPTKLNDFINNFAKLEGPKVLIHGGGKVATKISTALGIDTQMINGRRVTDSDTLDVVTMVYAGLINKRITAALNAAGCSSIGLCGADGSLIISDRRDPEPVDYGYVGDPVSVNTTLVSTLTADGYTIVTAPITSDGKGTLLNTNADTVAQCIATAMAMVTEVELIYCFEKNGVLLDMEDDTSVIPRIVPVEFEELKGSGIVSDGMLPKLENAFKAISEGVKKVVICHADNIGKAGYGGTTITQ